MPVCRVLWMDLKGTTAALAKEPEAVPKRMSRFYEICATAVKNFDSKLGVYRSFNFSDTHALLLYSKERDVPSATLMRVADYLIERCASQGMTVRGFITNGVENRDEAEEIRAPMGRGDTTRLHEVLFSVNTAVLAANIGEKAHLPGKLLISDQMSRFVDETAQATFFVDSDEVGFRREGQHHFDLRSGKQVVVSPPGYVFHQIR